MSAIDIIDWPFAWLSHQILHVLCHISGKSNFWWARFAAGTSGVAFVTVLTILEYEQPRPGDVVPVALLLLLWWRFVLIGSLPLIARMEKGYSGGSDAAAIPELRPWQRLLRVAAVGCLLYDLIEGPLVWVWIDPFFWISLALYFATDFIPPKKSWAKRGIEKLHSLRTAKPRLGALGA